MTLEKALPASFNGDYDTIERAGWQVTQDVPLPNLLLDRSILRSNVQHFQDFIDDHGALLAPHAKATMCPLIWQEQLNAGAWALTVATVSQLEVCIAFGVKRVLIANEVTDRYSLRRLAELVAQHEELELMCLVDSEKTVQRLAAAISESTSVRRLDVLVEFGMPGGRTGVRSIESLVDLARAVASHSKTLRLVGVEGYEGILGISRSDQALAEVDGYLSSWVEAIRQVFPLIESSAPRLASAGGSIYFDRVIAAFAPLVGDGQLIIRSGCYATHDSGMFDAASPFGAVALGPDALLRPALRVYAAVLSRPEPELAIVGAGVRDVPVSEGLPKVHAVHASDGTVRDGANLRPTKANDQHLYVEVPENTPLAVGDVLELGISHPCAVFDLWRTFLVADGDQRVIGAGRTYF